MNSDTLTSAAQAILQKTIDEEQKTHEYFRKCHNYFNVTGNVAVIFVEGTVSSENSKSVDMNYEVVALNSFLKVNQSKEFFNMVQNTSPNQYVVFYVQLAQADKSGGVGVFGRAEITSNTEVDVYNMMNMRIRDLRSCRTNVFVWKGVDIFHQDNKAESLMLLDESFSLVDDKNYRLDTPFNMVPVSTSDLKLNTDHFDPTKVIVYRATFHTGGSSITLHGAIERMYDYTQWMNMELINRVESVKNSPDINNKFFQSIKKTPGSFALILHRQGMLNAAPETVNYNCITLKEYQKFKLPNADKIGEELLKLQGVGDQYLLVVVTNESTGLHAYFDTISAPETKNIVISNTLEPISELVEQDDDLVEEDLEIDEEKETKPKITKREKKLAKEQIQEVVVEEN